MISVFGYDAPAPPAMDIGGPNAFLGGGYGDGYEPQLDFTAFFEAPPLIAPNGTMVSGGEAEPMPRLIYLPHSTHFWNRLMEIEPAYSGTFWMLIQLSILPRMRVWCS
jgi:hypothetical protein